jgi:septation ring formation regulator EzrA
VNVDKRFDKVDERFDRVDERFDRIEDRMESGFNRLNDRIDDLAKVLIGGVIAFTAAMLAGFAGILALIATQL